MSGNAYTPDVTGNSEEHQGFTGIGLTRVSPVNNAHGLHHHVGEWGLAGQVQGRGRSMMFAIQVQPEG